MDRLSHLFGSQLALRCGCFDRIVLRGFYPRLQREANIVHFFQEVVGAKCVDQGALASRTLLYRQWLDGYVREHDIPRLEAAKGVRKEELVAPSYRRLGQREGVACILTSMERGRTFFSYTPKKPGTDPDYRPIKSCWKQFLHVYFYLLDPVLGPMSLRVATYLPFTIQVYVNGHSFVAQQLRRQGIAFRQEDNAFLAVDDVSALEMACAALTPALLRQRCDYWANQLTPRFSLKEQAGAGLAGYCYSLAQVEYADDVVFQRSGQLQARFRRAAELGALLGGADRTAMIFGKRITQRHNGKLETVLKAANQGRPVLRSMYHSSFVKQYEKDDRLLRTETCVNDPLHLNVRRGLDNLPLLQERMAATNQRYLDLQAELLDSCVDLGELAWLATPTLQGQRRIPGIRLQDERVMRLWDVALQPAGLVADWTTADLRQRVAERHRLEPDDYRLSQLRYDLSKLRAKGLVERLQGTRRYRLTALGLRLGTVLVKLRFRLFGPLATLAFDAPRPRSHHPSPVEIALRRVSAALDNLCSVLYLRAA